MVPSFRPLQQPPGSKSCLTVCIRAILRWHNQPVSQAEVAEWCQEDRDGTLWDLALDGLRSEGFDVEEIFPLNVEEAPNLLAEFVNDLDTPQPVIVTLLNPFLSQKFDHAVVLLDIEFPEVGDTMPAVSYMDPLTGTIERDTTGRFWHFWDYAGQRAFTLRP